MLLIKMGGSVITNKDKECTFLPKRARRLVEELRYIDEPLIVTHGGGSFGHKKASYYRLKEGLTGPSGKDMDQLLGLSEVQKDMRELNNLVLDMMTKANIRAVSVPTASVVTFSGGKMSKMEYTHYEKALSLDLVPVSFGDVVYDTKLTFTICSADDLMVKLAKRFRPRLVIFITDVEGLYAEDPFDDVHARLIREVRSGRDIPKALKGKGAKKGDRDVTGGMGKKVRAALDIASAGIETWFINGGVEDRLSRLVKGREVVGTRFHAKRPSKRKEGKGK